MYAWHVWLVSAVLSAVLSPVLSPVLSIYLSSTCIVYGREGREEAERRQRERRRRESVHKAGADASDEQALSHVMPYPETVYQKVFQLRKRKGRGDVKTKRDRGEPEERQRRGRGQQQDSHRRGTQMFV
jgi:hypothetical protein